MLRWKVLQFVTSRKLELRYTKWNVFLFLETCQKFIVIYYLYIYLQLGLDAGDMQISDSFTEEKVTNKIKFDFLNRHDMAEVKAKVGS